MRTRAERCQQLSRCQPHRANTLCVSRGGAVVEEIEWRAVDQQAGRERPSASSVVKVKPLIGLEGAYEICNQRVSGKIKDVQSKRRLERKAPWNLNEIHDDG